MSFVKIHSKLPKDVRSIQRCNFSNLPDVSKGGPKMYGNIPALKDNVEFKNIALQAGGGRQSVSGIRATVFGAGSTGLGHHIVNRLGPIGAQVILPHRDDGHSVKRCKLAGDLGQIVPIKYQIRDKDTVMRSLEGSNVCINLLTQWRETKNFSYHDIHVNATHMIAKCAYELKVDRFIYISMAGAAEDSPSEYLRTKWLGEQVVKEYYPEATILRPSIMFGHNDKFIKFMARCWKLWVRMPYVIGPESMVQPVAIPDCSLAVLKCVVDPLLTGGKTYELYGDFKAKKERWFERVGNGIAAQKPNFRRIEPLYRLPLLKVFDPIHRMIPQLFFRILSHSIPAEHIYSHDEFVRATLDFVEPTRPFLGLRDLGITPTNYFDMEPILLYYWNTFENVPHQSTMMEDENPGPNFEHAGAEPPHPIIEKSMANWPCPDRTYERDMPEWFDVIKEQSLPRDYAMQGSQTKYFKHLKYDY